MAIDVSAAPSAAAAQRWRVSLEREALTRSLCDYFRRLGLSPEVRGQGVLDITADEDHDLEGYVASWSRVNGVAARLDRIDAPQPLLLPPPPGAGQPRLGELLVRKGFITEEQLAWALTEARATNELLGVVLLRERFIFEDELARTLSQQLGIPYIGIMLCGVNPRVARVLPYDAGMRAAAIPVRSDGDRVQVAFADPTDQRAVATVREHVPKISVGVAELSDIKSAWREVARRDGLA